MLLVVVVGVTTHSQELSRHNSRALDDESIQSQVFSGIGSYSDMSIIIIIFAPETNNGGFVSLLLGLYSICSFSIHVQHLTGPPSKC